MRSREHLAEVWKAVKTTVTFERLMLSVISIAAVAGCVFSGQTSAMLQRERQAPTLAPLEWHSPATQGNPYGGEWVIRTPAVAGETEASQRERHFRSVAAYVDDIESFMREHHR